MTFTLSRERIAEELYATSAMYALICPGSVAPPALHRDHRSMLDAAMTDAFISLCVSILPHVADTSLDTDSDPELMEVDLILPDGFADRHTTPLRRLMESFVASTVLSNLYRNYSDSLADVNADAAREQLRRIRRMLDPGLRCSLIPVL